MELTLGVVGSSVPLLNPKVAKVFLLKAGGRQLNQDAHSFDLDGANVIEGFRRQGYCTICSGAVAWFDTTTDTGAVLAQPFDQFQFAGDTWSLNSQLDWIDARLQELQPEEPCFLFLNVGETHIPYWHQGAPWPRWPSPCEPLGGPSCSALESRRRQRACLAWVDQQLAPLLQRFSAGTVLVCADHGDCWGENGLWAHGFSHPAILTVPLILRVRGEPVHA